MADRALERVLRSEELPTPTAAGDGPAKLRERATTGTIVLPEYREVELGGARILLTRLATGEPIAFGGYCPHQGTDLRRATIFGGNVRCEQHKFVYDPATGRNILPSRDASPKALERLKPGWLPVYDVEERDGWVWVSPEPKPPPDESTPLPADAVPAEVAGPRHAPPDELPQRAPQTVDAVAGEPFELVLETDVVPNHLWQVEVSGDPVEVTDQRLDQAGGTVRYVLTAVPAAAGTAELRCRYTKPWGSDVRDEYVFTVDVRDA